VVNSIAKYVTVKDNENKLKAISKQDENRLAEAIPQHKRASPSSLSPIGHD